jgi:type I restriction enzyme R subunit
MLETVRTRLRALVKLLPKGQKKQVYTDFEDSLGEAVQMPLPQVMSGLNMARFHDKARAFLREHEDHLALQRLANGGVRAGPGDGVGRRVEGHS